MFTKNQLALQTFVANGLVEKRSVAFASNIANAPRGSAKQLWWVDKLVTEILEKQNPQSAKIVPSGGITLDTSKIFRLFDNAFKHKLKFPKITLQFAVGEPLRLSMGRKHPDTVWLSHGGFGSTNYGNIRRSGVLTVYHQNKTHLDDALEGALINVVKDFAADPEKVAAEHGKLTHNCCYCAKQLDTPESLAQGYGPVCARHWDLPWGKNAARIKPNIQELVEEGTVQTVGQALKSELDELMPSEDFDDECCRKEFRSNGIYQRTRTI